jgi:hypothetical protein
MSDSRNEAPASDDNQSQRYIKIAKACLNAINQSGTGDEPQSAKVQRVYDAIDEAFQSEFHGYRESLTVMTAVLERIASGTLDRESAAQLARQTLEQNGGSATGNPIH